MKSKLLGCLAVWSFLMSYCTKEPLDNLTADESRIYLTNYDTSVRFSNYRTFSMVDSVAVFQNNQFQGKQITPLDAQFIAAFASAMQSRGFVRVNKNQNPDLGVALSRINNTSTNIVSYPNYYGGGYGGFYDPFYSSYPGYSYYYPNYYSVYQTSENALTIDIFDLKNSTQNNQLRNVWSAMIRGSSIFNSANVESQIAALMNQSAYLKNQ